jgi:cell division protein FtsB
VRSYLIGAIGGIFITGSLFQFDIGIPSFSSKAFKQLQSKNKQLQSKNKQLQSKNKQFQSRQSKLKNSVNSRRKRLTSTSLNRIAKRSAAALVPVLGSAYILKKGVDNYCENLKEIEIYIDTIDGTNKAEDFDKSRCYENAKDDVSHFMDTVDWDFSFLTSEDND